jgi:lipopolysaccharide transport system ATP-binding protein
MYGGIAVEDLGKHFRRRNADAPRTMREWLLRGRKGNPSGERFWALRNLTMNVAPGEMIGVIGRNGSGKSTLLRMLGGVMEADEGRVTVNGRVSGLLTLNTGIHEDLSGRENIVISGVIAGLTRSEVRERMADIIRFSELEDSIDNPVRTYSSGMKLRLGFATAAHVEPDVLLIDEVLSVGDLAFQRKCLDRIEDFRRRGGTIVLITHDLSQVEQLCDRAVWLDRGKLAAIGDPAIVLSEYRDAMAGETHARTNADAGSEMTEQGIVLRPHENRFGSLEGRISRVRLLGRDGLPARRIMCGDPLMLELSFDAGDFREPAVLSVSLGNEEQGDCLELNTENEGYDLPTLERWATFRLEIDRLDLAPGDYLLTVGLYKKDWSYALDYHWRAYPISVEGKAVAKGALSPPRQWQLGFSGEAEAPSAEPGSSRGGAASLPGESRAHDGVDR